MWLPVRQDKSELNCQDHVVKVSTGGYYPPDWALLDYTTWENDQLEPVNPIQSR